MSYFDQVAGGMRQGGSSQAVQAGGHRWGGGLFGQMVKGMATPQQWDYGFDHAARGLSPSEVQQMLQMFQPQMGQVMPSRQQQLMALFNSILGY